MTEAQFSTSVDKDGKTIITAMVCIPGYCCWSCVIKYMIKHLSDMEQKAFITQSGGLH